MFALGITVCWDVASFLVAVALLVPFSAPVRTPSLAATSNDSVSLLTVLRDCR